MESASENEQTRAIKTGDHHANDSNQHPNLSKSELLTSAKVVADAARHRGENKVDKAELAGAAANLLHAASEYGKMEDKPLGKIVGKAENHLRHYHTSHSTSTTTTSGHSTTTTTTTTETTHSSTNHPGKDHGHSGGDHEWGKSKYGEYIQMAEGVLKKHSGGGSNKTETSTPNTHSSSGTGGEHGGHSGSESGYGQYVKMAGDFLKKH